VCGTPFSLSPKDFWLLQVHAEGEKWNPPTQKTLKLSTRIVFGWPNYQASFSNLIYYKYIESLLKPLIGADGCEIATGDCGNVSVQATMKTTKRHCQERSA